ncbi:hypothetical protein A3K42_01490 [candidate division WWE3 bacterium RBG_13_37_7]|uniref:Uncharacterized protein n=1 Tax=candidate division WWE3 bacterium RBG_13_37_7 TaxID=1802609 RepID=A0A1F4U143_UNCKA|nr:MAG: hypothetical protein A3K42_01490 [candidate division WWE3 bacterium RBG_13_37_7]
MINAVEKNNSTEDEAEIDWSKARNFLRNNPKDFLIDIYRDFGVPGVLTYIGGVILLFHFPNQPDSTKQVLYAICGLVLLVLATFISYLRIKSQRDREKSLFDMAQDLCNRLAEQLGKGLNDKQVEGVSQKIRQIQRDTRTTIFDQPIEK